jgi:superfamily II DNA/RNA helicase
MTLALALAGRLAQRRATQHVPGFCASFCARPAAFSTSFAELGVSAELIEGLASLPNFSPSADEARPTLIQQRSFAPITSGEDVVIGAETGSGKTLGYLLPVIQRIKALEVAGRGRAPPRRPTALVVTPSRELSEQVFGVAKHLSHFSRLRVASFLGGEGARRQRTRLDNGVDLAVSSPGRLRQLWEGGALHLSGVEVVVIDEADTLLTEGFDDELLPIFRALDARQSRGGSRCQFVLAGASFAPSARRVLRRLFPDASAVSTPRLHALPDTLTQRVVRPASNDKHPALLDAILGAGNRASLRAGEGRGAGELSPATDLGDIEASSRERPLISRPRPTLVFCNSIDSCRSTEHALREAGIESAGLHGGIPPRLRAENFRRFRQGDASVLVATDIAARGLDLPGVERVINFEFPRTGAEFLHRCGRTARAGARGEIVHLLHGRDAPRASAIRRGLEQGRVLTLAEVEDATDRRRSDGGAAGGDPGGPWLHAAPKEGVGGKALGLADIDRARALRASGAILDGAGARGRRGTWVAAGDARVGFARTDVRNSMEGKGTPRHGRPSTVGRAEAEPSKVASHEDAPSETTSKPQAHGVHARRRSAPCSSDTPTRRAPWAAADGPEERRRRRRADKNNGEPAKPTQKARRLQQQQRATGIPAQLLKRMDKSAARAKRAAGAARRAARVEDTTSRPMGDGRPVKRGPRGARKHLHAESFGKVRRRMRGTMTVG